MDQNELITNPSYHDSSQEVTTNMPSDAQYDSGFLNELGQPPEPVQEQPDPAQGLGEQVAAPSATALTEVIKRKRREVSDLEKKIETHRETNAYMKAGSNGEHYFDRVAMDEDIVRIGRLNREIGELGEQAREREKQGGERLQLARQLARQLAEREVKLVDQALRPTVTQNFVAVFNGMASAGEFGKSVYANRQTLDALLNQMWENALGNAVRRHMTGANQQPGQPAATGFDGADVQRPPDQSVNNEDPYTNNVMAAYENVKKRKSMTFAESKAAERERQRQMAMQGQGQTQEPTR